MRMLLCMLFFLLLLSPLSSLANQSQESFNQEGYGAFCDAYRYTIPHPQDIYPLYVPGVDQSGQRTRFIISMQENACGESETLCTFSTERARDDAMLVLTLAIERGATHPYIFCSIHEDRVHIKSRQFIVGEIFFRKVQDKRAYLYSLTLQNEYRQLLSPYPLSPPVVVL